MQGSGSVGTDRRRPVLARRVFFGAAMMVSVVKILRPAHRYRRARVGVVVGLVGVLVLSLAARLAVRRDALTVPAALPELTAKIDREAPRLLARHRVPGAAVAVVWRGRPAWARGYGFSGGAAAGRVTAATVFQVASVSKPVSALGILIVAARRRLDLDAPVAPRLRGWRFPASEYDPRGVTLRRLLSHTAGLSVPGYPGHRPDRPLPSTIASLSGDSAGAGAVRLTARPGAEYRYSGGGYLVAQALVEDVTGRPFGAVMRDLLLEPTGMRASRYGIGGEPAARGHDANGRPLPDYRVELAPGGLRSTAPDLAHFLAALMAPTSGPIAHAVVVEALTPAAGTGGDYGLGFALRTLAGGDRMISHDGSNRGWRSLIVAFPDRQLGLVVLTNGDNGDAVTNGLLRLLVR